MVRPVWFIDVDGVINVLVDHAHKPHLASYPDWKNVVANGYNIVFSPSLIEAVNIIGETTEIVFLSTWAEQGVESLAPALGLNITKFLRCGGSNSSFQYRDEDASKRWWKLNGVLAHIQNDQRDFIWTDDDIHNDIRKAVSGRAKFEGIEHLMLTPDSHVGLTKQHIRTIEAFVSRVSKPTLI